jgi:hypothetical protein
VKNSNFSYKYQISFRISHPTRDLSEVSNRILEIEGLELGRIWKVGDPRVTIKNMPLEGVYKESCCGFSFGDEWQSAMLEKDDLPEAIETFIDKLYPYKDVFKELVSTGGGLDFHIGCFFERGAGMEFHDELIAKLADLKIGFGVNFYTSDEEHKRWMKKHDEIEVQVAEIMRRYDLSGILSSSNSSEDDKKNAYEFVIQDVADLIEAGADEDYLANGLKEGHEWYERTKSDKLPKTIDGYKALAHEVFQIKW